MRQSPLVKICGITNSEDALWATNLGADYIGLNFCSMSKRKISLDKAKEISLGLPPFIKTVAVCMDMTIPEIEKIIKSVKFSALQFHGQETAEFLQEIKSKFNVSVWKAFSIMNIEDLNPIGSYLGIADYILLDRPKDPLAEVLPISLDWKIASKAKPLGIPIFLAGGLTLENILEALKIVEPQGVDVASGVEKKTHPRKKDIEKMRSFIEISKGHR